MGKAIGWCTVMGATSGKPLMRNFEWEPDERREVRCFGGGELATIVLGLGYSRMEDTRQWGMTCRARCDDGQSCLLVVERTGIVDDEGYPRVMVRPSRVERYEANARKYLMDNTGVMRVRIDYVAVGRQPRGSTYKVSVLRGLGDSVVDEELRAVATGERWGDGGDAPLSAFDMTRGIMGAFGGI